MYWNMVVYTKATIYSIGDIGAYGFLNPLL